MVTGLKSREEERGSDSEREEAMMGSILTEREDAIDSGADGGAVGSIIYRGTINVVEEAIG